MSTLGRTSRQGSSRPTQPSPSPLGPSSTKDIPAAPEKYPAANLLHALIRFNNVDATRALRDVHTSGAVVTRSNKVYEAIIKAMDTLDTSTFEQLANNWTLFDNYTIAIPVLERILLGLTSTLSKERKHAPPDTSTHDAVTHINFWLADRKALKDALEALKGKQLQAITSSNAEVLAEYATHRRNDDLSTLKVVQEFIAKDKLSDREIIQKAGLTLLSDVKKLLGEVQSKWQQKPPSEEVDQVVVRVFLTAYIPFAVIASPKTTVDWQTYLKSEKIWDALKVLLTKVKEFVEKPSESLLTDVLAEFGNVETLLLKLTETTVETAKEMLELIKLCTFIHRPYSGRSVALAKTLYHVDQFSQDKKTLVARRYDIKQALQTAIDHLTKLKETPYDLKSFSFDGSEYTTRKEQHKKLFDSNETLYTTFSVPRAEWTTQTEAYATAVGVDEKNVKDAQAQLFSQATK